MSFVAVAIGGAAVVGAGATLYASGKAAKAEKGAAGAATAEEQREYDQNRTDLAPYRDAGYTALAQLGKGTADGGEFNTSFTAADLPTDPGYQFRLDQGNRGVEASAAARGGVLSGAAVKALDRYNQGEASQEYGAAYDRYQTDLTGRYDRLASLAGVGQQAVNTGVAAGQQTAGEIGSNITSAGNATASGYVAGANAITGAANNVSQYFALKGLVGNPASAAAASSSGYGGYTGTGDYGYGSAGAYGVAGSDGIY